MMRLFTENKRLTVLNVRQPGTTKGHVNLSKEITQMLQHGDVLPLAVGFLK